MTARHKIDAQLMPAVYTQNLWLLSSSREQWPFLHCCCPILSSAAASSPLIGKKALCLSVVVLSVVHVSHLPLFSLLFCLFMICNFLAPASSTYLATGNVWTSKKNTAQQPNKASTWRYNKRGGLFRVCFSSSWVADLTNTLLVALLPQGELARPGVPLNALKRLSPLHHYDLLQVWGESLVCNSLCARIFTSCLSRCLNY
jgi:hypothetical protein